MDWHWSVSPLEHLHMVDFDVRLNGSWRPRIPFVCVCVSPHGAILQSFFVVHITGVEADVA